MNRTLSKIVALAALTAASAGTFGQTAKLGLNFASTDPNADIASLLPSEAAGVVPQANWNNLAGNTGSGAGSLVYDLDGTSNPSTVSVTWSSPNTWRSTSSATTGGNNGFPEGPDRKLTTGYLDTGNTAANGISITVTGIDPVFTGSSYDVYIYFVSDSGANRGGAYTIDDGTGARVKYGSTMANPASFIEDPGTDADLTIDGTYLRFVGLSGTSFTLTTDTTLTTPNGFRAPINAIQLVPTEPFGPDITRQPVAVALYAGGTARFTAAADGFPAVTALQWRKNGVNVVDNERISGATTGSLTITGATAGDAGDYTLVATSSSGTGTSEPAALTLVSPSSAEYVSAIVAAGPLANWRLNEPGPGEPGEVTTAFDYVGGFTGQYMDGAWWGSTVPGPQAPAFPGLESDNTAVETGATFTDSFVAVPAPELNVNTATFIAWIHPTFQQLDFTGIFMNRDGNNSGIGYTTDNQLGYTWNNNSTWSWNSGLRPPSGQWSFVALVVEPEQATLYLGSSGSLNGAINPIPHTSEAWGRVARIGIDGATAARTFTGAIDEVAMFNRALSFEEIVDLYETATGVPQTTPPNISPQPQPSTRYEGQTVQFVSAATGSSLTFQWQKDEVDLANDARISGATSAVLTIQDVTAADEGDYRVVVTNPYGSSTSDPALLTTVAVPEGYVADVLEQNPLSYWRLNETADPSTGAPALDYWGGRNGTYGVASRNGFHDVEGPRPSSGFGSFEEDNYALEPTANLADSWATVPGPGISTDTLTILAWINPDALVPNGGIAFARAGQPATGLGHHSSGNLGYHWLDTATTYNWNSGITPPLNQWSMVALVVEPAQATLYQINSGGVLSSVNTVTHAVRAFTDNIRIGGDPNNVNRTFDGRIDEVAIFDQALSLEDLEALYIAGVAIVAPAIAANPVSREEFAGVPVQFTVGASGTEPLTYQWQRESGGSWVPVTDGGRISGATTATLAFSEITAADAGQYRAVVTNAQGSATSEPATLSLLPTPPAPAEGSFGGAVLESGALSYWRLNEDWDPGTGTAQIYDYAGGRHGLYGAAAFNGFHGVAGPRPSDGFNLFEEANTALESAADTANSWATVPGPGITTDSLTIAAWIRPSTLVPNAGIVFARAGLPATGVNLNGAGMLGYHWLDTAGSYSWASGITPPLNQWSLVALTVEPAQATVYLINADGVQSAVNSITHAPRAFTDTIRIGGDPNNVNRTFSGITDEVALFDFAMTSAQVQALFEGEGISLPPELSITGHDGQITITWDQPGTLQSTSALEGGDTVWTTETTTGNSHTVEPAGTAKFYRLVQ